MRLVRAYLSRCTSCCRATSEGISHWTEKKAKAYVSAHAQQVGASRGYNPTVEQAYLGAEGATRGYNKQQKMQAGLMIKERRMCGFQSHQLFTPQVNGEALVCCSTLSVWTFGNSQVQIHTNTLT